MASNRSDPGQKTAYRIASAGIRATRKALQAANAGKSVATAASGSVAAMLAGLCVLLLLFASAIPSGMLGFNSSGSYSSYRQRTIEVLKREIMHAVRVSDGADQESMLGYAARIAPGYCSPDTTEIFYYGGSWHASSSSCRLEFKLTPGAEGLADNISAYASAVHGTLSDFRMDEDAAEQVDFEGQIESVPDGPVLEGEDIGEDAREWLKGQESLDSYLDIDQYTYELASAASEFLEADGNHSHWINEGVWYDRVYLEDEKTWLTRANGTVLVPLYYDLSSYKMDELQETMNTLSQELGNEFEAREYMSSLMNGYYDSYFKVSGREDNRYEIFRWLIMDGTMLTIPISGLNPGILSTLYDADPGWDGDIGNIFDIEPGKYGPGTAEYNAIWGAANKAHKDKLISGSVPYNCTRFADYIFYCKYGYDGLAGDGGQMATYLVGHHDDQFKYGAGPAPGGIVSVQNGGAGHVLFVNAVDYQNKKITISEGNVNGNGTIWIAVEMTFDEFLAHEGRNSTYIYANPR